MTNFVLRLPRCSIVLACSTFVLLVSGTAIAAELTPAQKPFAARLSEAASNRLEAARLERLETLNRQMKSVVEEIQAANREAGRTTASAATKLRNALRMELAKLTRTSAFEFGILLLEAIDGRTYATSYLRDGRYKSGDINEAASRVPLIRYRKVIGTPDANGKILCAFTVIEVPEPQQVQTRSAEQVEPIDLGSAHHLLQSFTEQDVAALKSGYLARFPHVKPAAEPLAITSGRTEPLFADARELFTAIRDGTYAGVDEIELEHRRRLIECWGKRIDQSDGILAKAETVLRTDEAMNLLIELAASNTLPQSLSSEARKQLAMMKDIRAIDGLSKVAVASTIPGARDEAIKTIGGHLASGWLPAASALGVLAESDRTEVKTPAALALKQIENRDLAVASLWRYWKCDQPTVSAIARKMLKSRMVFDERIAEGDALILATAREAFTADLKRAIARTQSNVAAEKSQEKKSSGVPSILGGGKSRDKGPSREEVRLRELKQRVTKLSQMRPVEFGAEVLVEVDYLKRVEASTLSDLRDIVPAADVYHRLTREEDIFIEREVIEFDANGTPYERTVSEINFDFISGVVGSLLVAHQVNVLMAQYGECRQIRKGYERSLNGLSSEGNHLIRETFQQSTK